MRIMSVVILLLFCACQGEVLDKDALIDSYYAEKVNGLKQERIAICQEKVLDEAKASIDSLIDTWVNAELIDTIRFPSRPGKPLKPDPIIDKFQKFPLDSSLLDK